MTNSISKSIKSSVTLPSTYKIEGVSLMEFLETKYKKNCRDEVGFYNHWKQGMFYQNWFISSLIGTGAFAKVYQVKHVEESSFGALSEKFYAMKAIKKSKLAGSTFLNSTM
jgi:hypothetical protein